MFSNDGPNLIRPALTNKPRVIPKIYKLKNNNNRGKPNFRIETPNNGEVKITAGTKPIKVLIKAVKISEIIISLVFTALIRALIGLVPAILLTSPLFGISLLDLGLPLALLFLSLYIFGITLGLFVSAGLIRFGPSFENIAWSTMFLLAPFGCIYYPVETLPEIFQSIAFALPLVYIFEETRIF